ncbi:NAD/NADP octopine/nopaline dehydrogenase family protein [Roseibium sp. M-1]
MSDSRLACDAYQLCIDLFCDIFVQKVDLLTITLSNLNPQTHLGFALFDLTRIEHGQTWGQNSIVTSAVGRFLEVLDCARLTVAAAFVKGADDLRFLRRILRCDREYYISDCRNPPRPGCDPIGPKDPATRYVLEDFPFVLVPIVYLGQLCGVGTPLHQCGIDILSACYSRDFSADNDLLSEIEQLDYKTLPEITRDGYPDC